MQEGYLEVHEEYIRGRTLEQLRREAGPLDDDTLLDIARDVCRALTVLHGLLGRVIKKCTAFAPEKRY